MQQSNALRRLEIVLDKAVAYQNQNEPAGLVLLNAMKLNANPQNIVGFYELLSKAKEESVRINKPKIDRYISTLRILHEVFILHHVWNTEWKIFSDHIENTNGVHLSFAMSINT